MSYIRKSFEKRPNRQVFPYQCSRHSLAKDESHCLLFCSTPQGYLNTCATHVSLRRLVRCFTNTLQRFIPYASYRFIPHMVQNQIMLAWFVTGHRGALCRCQQIWRGMRWIRFTLWGSPVLKCAKVCTKTLPNVALKSWICFPWKDSQDDRRGVVFLDEVRVLQCLKRGNCSLRQVVIWFVCLLNC